MSQKPYISTATTIEEYNNGDFSFTLEFPSLYAYALYLCSGDFKAFDDVDKLNKAINGNYRTAI